MITFEDLKNKAKLKELSSDRDKSIIEKNIFSGISPNVKCANLVDIIFDKIIDLMKKDEKISGVKKYAVVKGAENLKDPVKKYILLDMSADDAVDMVEKSKKELSR